MTDGDGKGQHCARCYALLTPPMVYRDGLWFHQSCWRAGVEQLRNATRLAAVSSPLFQSVRSASHAGVLSGEWQG
jgi:hypothetical protein